MFVKIGDIGSAQTTIYPDTVKKYVTQFDSSKLEVVPIEDGYHGRGTHPQKGLPFIAVDKNHRLEAMKEMGVEFVPVKQGRGEPFDGTLASTIDEHFMKTKSQLTDIWKQANQ